MSERIEKHASSLMNNLGDVVVNLDKANPKEAQATAAAMFRGIGDGIERMPKSLFLGPKWIQILIMVLEFLVKLLKALFPKDPP